MGFLLFSWNPIGLPYNIFLYPFCIFPSRLPPRLPSRWPGAGRHYGEKDLGVPSGIQPIALILKFNSN